MSTPPGTCLQCGAALTPGTASCPYCSSAVQTAKAEAPQTMHTPLSSGEKHQIPREFLGLRRPKVQQPLSGSLVMPVLALIFALVFTLSGIFLLALGIGGHISETNAYRQLVQEGVVVQGSIQALRIDDDADSSTYYVDYQFTAPMNGDPTRMQGSQSVSADVYRSLRVGQSIAVRYAPSDPALSTLEVEFGPPNIIFPLVVGGTGGLGTLFGLGMTVSCARNITSLRHLRLRGRDTHACIVDRWEDKDAEGDTIYCIAYAFTATLPDRRLVTVTRAEQNKQIYDRYRVGDTLPVRYLPDDPNVCQLQT